VAESYDRLVRCFLSVFPSLTEAEIRTVDVALLINSDSLAGVTLLSLIDEEFGVDLDIEILLELGSPTAIAGYLDAQKSSDTPSTNYK